MMVVVTSSYYEVYGNPEYYKYESSSWVNYNSFNGYARISGSGNTIITEGSGSPGFARVYELNTPVTLVVQIPLLLIMTQLLWAIVHVFTLFMDVWIVWLLIIIY